MAISKAFQGSVAPEPKYEKHKRSGQFLAPSLWLDLLKASASLASS